MKNSISLSSILGDSVSANRRAATIFLDRLVRAGLPILLACLCLSAAAQNVWVWRGGNNTVSCTTPAMPPCSQPGVYGSENAPSAGNIPGSRFLASSWADSNGNLWLFGGGVTDASGSQGLDTLNDLWEFYPATNYWVWRGGNQGTTSCNQEVCHGQPGKYVKMGTPPDPNNYPGARLGASSWTTNSGSGSRLWLFGGRGFDASGSWGDFNDLWEFDPWRGQHGEWVWVGQSNTAISQAGVYSSTTGPVFPGGRYLASSWTTTDSGGHSQLWLFGGYGYDTNGKEGSLNDLWKFDTNASKWTPMGGGQTVNGKGVYGMLRTADVKNIPGARTNSVSWTDSSGYLWLFGGDGYDANGNSGWLNDLWEFNPSLGTQGEWTWMGGSSTIGSICDNYGHCGTATIPSFPGARTNSVGWADSSGNLWLFGGHGFDSSGAWGWLNDFWEYNISANSWTLVGGSSIINGLGVYGPLPGQSAFPGNRADALSWTDKDGNFWLFGGDSYDGNEDVDRNDLWEYRPNTTAAAGQMSLGAPLFNPQAGSYTGTTLKVALSNPVSNPPNTLIYYTTDGSAPMLTILPGNTKTMKYNPTNGITVSGPGPETIYAIAVYGNTYSSVAGATYTPVSSLPPGSPLRMILPHFRPGVSLRPPPR